ncbi:MAG TPA: PrsW family glutamic-type intramembrane protease [Terriglobales bacterium]|nr:PrsW family glutamic-type intramembrane protease [Terriglobales bacterium]
MTAAGRAAALAATAVMILALYIAAESLPPVVLAAAMMPSFLAISLVFVASGRDREPVIAAIAMVASGGAFAALPASYLSAQAGAAVPSAPAWLVPLIEEIAKLFVLVLLAYLLPRRPSRRNGALRGALVGFGFTIVENTQYLLLAAVMGGSDAMLRAVYLRGAVGGLHHALFAATSGVGLAMRQAGGNAWVSVAALAWAGLQHVAWNAVAAPLVGDRLCGAATAGAACQIPPAPLDAYVTVPLVTAVALAPGAAVLFGLLRRQR